MPLNPRARSWCFTSNNYTDAIIDALAVLDCKYIVYGKEVGESGTPHLQGFVMFKNAKTMTAVKKLITGNPHLETMKGTPVQAAEYCKKEAAPEDIYERGAPPKTDQQRGEDEKKRFERAWELAKNGDIEEIDADIRMRCYGTIKRIKSDYQVAPAALDTLDFHWYYGPSGTGKSRTARSDNPGAYLKSRNKWWNGYVDQECVIIEEWNPEMVGPLNQMLKEWCDHHPFAAETKGNTICIRPPRIIITSNYSLEECFGHDQVGLLEPLKRRIQVRYFPVTLPEEQAAEPAMAPCFNPPPSCVSYPR